MTTATPPPATPVDPARTRGFGAVALVLGGFAGLLPFLPADLGEAGPWLPLPFALVGLFVGIFGCGGQRRGNTWAVVGSVVCAIAVGLATVLAIAAPKSGKDTVGPGHTEEILRDELDVRLGERRVDPETGLVYMTVTLYNKGPYTASYGVTIEVDGEESCEDGVSASLPPGASHQAEVAACDSGAPREVRFTVTEAHKESY